MLQEKSSEERFLKDVPLSLTVLNRRKYNQFGVSVAKKKKKPEICIARDEAEKISERQGVKTTVILSCGHLNFF